MTERDEAGGWAGGRAGARPPAALSLPPYLSLTALSPHAGSGVGVPFRSGGRNS